MCEPETQDWRNDAELFEAINRGDHSAFESLYERHREWVYSLAYRFTGNREEALDVLQEVFSYLLRKAPDLQLTTRITTYLYPMTRNIALTGLRERRRNDRAIRRKAEERFTPPPETAVVKTDLAAALTILSEDQREVLLMKYVDGMRLQEIAEALAIPVGTVKSRVHHAITALRKDERTRSYFEE